MSAEPISQPRPRGSDPEPAFAVRRARGAQAKWAKTPLPERLGAVRRFRELVAERAEDLAASVPNRPDSEVTLSAEILPLVEACRFLESEAESILRSRRPRRRSPVWLRGTRVTLHRRPLGVVLVIGPSNYPIFLPGVQALHALVAGNAAVLKPGTSGGPAARALARLFADAGVDPDLVPVLDDSPEAAEAILDAALAAGIDHVLLTGSADTGRAVLRRLAADLVPATVELSGSDAVFVLPGADLDRVARALRFGLLLNDGATCIAPRRVFVPVELVSKLERRLCEELRAAGSPISTVSPDLEIVPVDSLDRALELDADCPYALGASVFGPDEAARRFAERVDAGVVTTNDLIVPTADPRVPFGGHGESGFGRTRGAEGLFALTRAHAVVERRGSFLPHLDREGPGTRFFTSYLRAAHGPLRGRLGAFFDFVRAAIRSRRSGP